MAVWIQTWRAFRSSPWAAVPPYHLWLRDARTLGLNLAYVQADGEGGKLRHSLVEDARIGSEDSQRKFLPLAFEAPASAARPGTWIGYGRGRSRIQRLEASASRGRPSGRLAQRMSNQEATVGARSQRGTDPSGSVPSPSTISQVRMDFTSAV